MKDTCHIDIPMNAYMETAKKNPSLFNPVQPDKLLHKYNINKGVKVSPRRQLPTYCFSLGRFSYLLANPA